MPFLHSLYYTANERKCQGSFPFPLAIEKIFHFFIKKSESPPLTSAKNALYYTRNGRKTVSPPRFLPKWTQAFFGETVCAGFARHRQKIKRLA